MKISKSCCDQCGREAMNTAECPGWITIGTYMEGTQISISVTREPTQLRFKKEATRYDFCKSACLLDFLIKIKK